MEPLMQEPQRVLIAARPEVWEVIQPMLKDEVHLTTAHAMADAFRVLESEKIDLIISTIGFEESRMIEFLEAVKASIFASIPFLCARGLPGMIRDALIPTMRDACKACGAVDFIDVARLAPDRAKAALRAAVAACLQHKAPATGGR
jgi:CheY-like chemotaxis protein